MRSPRSKPSGGRGGNTRSSKPAQLHKTLYQKTNKQTKIGLNQSLRCHEHLLLMQMTYIPFPVPLQVDHTCLQLQFQGPDTLWPPQASVHVVHIHSLRHTNMSLKESLEEKKKSKPQSPCYQRPQATEEPPAANPFPPFSQHLFC